MGPDASWTLPAPAYGTHLPGGAMALSLQPQHVLTLRDMRHVHAVISNLLPGRHDPTSPMWSLLQVGDLAPSGWGLYVRDEGHLAALAGRAHPIELRSATRTRTARLSLDHAVRLRAPLPTLGHTRVEVEAVTPVTIQKSFASGGKVTYPRPSARALRGALEAVARRLGVEVSPDSIVVGVGSDATSPTATFAGGQLHATGLIHGWAGRVVVDVNPLARWLLDVASGIGLGAKVAMGFGRIRLRERILQGPLPDPPSILATAPLAEQVVYQYQARIDPTATRLQALDVLTAMADRATRCQPDAAGLWSDPATGARLVLHRLKEGHVIGAVVSCGSRPSSSDLAPPCAVTPAEARRAGRVIQVAPRLEKNRRADGASVTWTFADGAVEAYRERVERVAKERAEAAMLWHLARASHLGNGWWRGPSPASLLFLADRALVIDVRREA